VVLRPDGNSRFGFVIRGAKSNEVPHGGARFPVFRYRLAALVMAGAFGGLAGILLAITTSMSCLP